MAVELTESLLLMICTFPEKKNVRHYQQKEMVLVLYTCFVVNHLNPETTHLAHMCTSKLYWTK